MYTYHAKLERIVDADTLDLNIDLGFKVWVKVRVRLTGINAPEIWGVKKESEEYQKGKLALAYVEGWFSSLGSETFIVRTEKDEQEKYGRWLAEVTSLDGTKVLTEDLVNSGHAVEVLY